MEQQEKKQEKKQEPFFTTQILTYMGNKRKFIEPLNNILLELEKTLQKPKGELLIGEGFSGSGILSRLFKTHASHLFTQKSLGLQVCICQVV